MTAEKPPTNRTLFISLEKGETVPFGDILTWAKMEGITGLYLQKVPGLDGQFFFSEAPLTEEEAWDHYKAWQE